MVTAFLIGLAVFFVSVVQDIIWARYTQHVASGSRHKAAVMGTLIICVGAGAWFVYHKTLWYAIPMGVGAYIGTYIGTKKKVAQ